MKVIHFGEANRHLIHGEIEIHKKVYHPFIVQYLGEVIEKYSIYIFMEEMEHVSINLVISYVA